jgi:hypothetical protein
MPASADWNESYASCILLAMQPGCRWPPHRCRSASTVSRISANYQRNARWRFLGSDFIFPDEQHGIAHGPAAADHRALERPARLERPLPRL